MTKLTAIICLTVCTLFANYTATAQTIFELPKLPYDHNALEPYIDKETMQIHQFNYSPEVQCNLAYRFKKQKTTVAVFYKYNGKLPSFVLVNNEVQQSFMDHYQIMDATVSKLFFNDKFIV